MLTRLLTGVSVGGAFPLLYSLLGDMFPISQRAFVSSFIQIATGAGVFVGQVRCGAGDGAAVFPIHYGRKTRGGGRTDAVSQVSKEYLIS